MEPILKIKPSATISYMGPDSSYKDNTLHSAVFCMPTLKQEDTFNIRNETECLTTDETLYRIRHIRGIRDIYRAETQSLKQYMMMVDLWECPVSRIVEQPASHTHSDNYINAISLIYFGPDEEYTWKFYPSPLAYRFKTDDDNTIRTMTSGMLWDFAFMVPDDKS